MVTAVNAPFYERGLCPKARREEAFVPMRHCYSEVLSIGSSGRMISEEPSLSGRSFSFRRFFLNPEAPRPRDGEAFIVKLGNTD